jgi:hypothetical protein
VKPQATAAIALPPDHADEVGKVVFGVLGLDGAVLGEFEGGREVVEAEGSFLRAVARWPSDLAPAGGHRLVGIVDDSAASELTRVAPRLVSVNMVRGD